MLSRIGVFVAVIALLSCDPDVQTQSSDAEIIFADDFESGTLAAWEDGMDPSRHRIVSETGAEQGSRYLEVTYPARSDGGWLTRFFLPGYDSLFVRYRVRFPESWRGGTKLIALYGSRTDDRWSALGKAGTCPGGTDFFATMLIAEATGDPGPLRFYTYHPAMTREPDGVTCWGRFGDGKEQYVAPLELASGGWHTLELFVKLNTPGLNDGSQTFWVDGVQRGHWPALRFRDSDALRLNAIQLTFSVSGGVAQTQTLDVDDVTVRTIRPR